VLLQVRDLERLGQTALDEFNEDVAQRGVNDELDLERRVQRLEAKLEQLYAVAVTMVQREETLESVAAVWARMVAICDRIAHRLSALPKSPATRFASYDRILDIRNACEENRALHA
jgi:hypothetical protein